MRNQFDDSINLMSKNALFAENKNINETTNNSLIDYRIDRSCQKSLFGCRTKELEDVHVGDQVLSENSFIMQTINQQAIDLQTINGIEDQTHTKTKKATDKCSSSSENCEEEEADKVDFDNKIILDLNVDTSEYNQQNNQQKYKRSQMGEQSICVKPELKFFDKYQSMDQSPVSSGALGNFSKKIINEENGQSDFQTNSIISKNQHKASWIPEDAIFEKDEIERREMISQALKTRSMTQQQNNNSRKSQQNFEKATNIINRLLNSSMNRMMRVSSHVQNFVAILKLRYMSKNGKNLTDKDYMAINDLCIFHKMNIKQKNINFFIIQFNALMKLSSKIPLFMPTDSVRVIWDIFQVVFTYMFLYFYSILMFFANDEKDSEFIKRFYFYTFFYFILDILINFNTAYFDKDIIIKNRKQIAKQYMFSTLFLTDCTSLIVLATKVIFQNNSIVYNPNHNLLTYGFNSLIFLKSNGMSPKRKRFDYVFTLKENQKHVIKLINQLTSVITVAHIGIINFYFNCFLFILFLKIAAICWYFVGIHENEYEISWLQKADLQSSLYYQKYIYSIYWAITTMTTVGYGDIAATNYVEALFISINLIIFSCVFAYSINNIGFILQEIEKSSKQLNDNITTIQRQIKNLKYLNRKNVNISLKSRVRHYLSFLAMEQKDRDKDAEDQILSILSNKLRDEITVEINTKILNHYNIFSSNFSRQTLNKVVFKMKEVLVSPNEVIFHDEQIDDLSIYFIQSGIIEIYQHSILKQNKVNIISTLQNNQLFGEISFFTGLSRKASARSVNLSTLYKISREDFIEILKENDEDYERFKMIQEQIIFQKDLNQLHVECYTCKQVGHIASKCPKTHQEFDRQFIILKNNFSIFQERLEGPQIRIQKRFFSEKYLLVGKNIELCQQLKENLQDLNTEIYNMFDTDENMNGSYFSEEESEENDDDDDEEEDSQSSSSDDSNSQKSSKSNYRSKKNSYQKKKSSKLYKKDGTRKLPTLHQSESKDSTSQNNDQQSMNNTISKQLSEKDKDEYKKYNSRKQQSYNKIQSTEINDCGGPLSVVQNESSNNIPNINGIEVGIFNKQFREFDIDNVNLQDLQILSTGVASDIEVKKKKSNKKEKHKILRNKTHGPLQQESSHDIESVNSSSDSNQKSKVYQNQITTQTGQYQYSIQKCISNKSFDENFHQILSNSNKINDSNFQSNNEQKYLSQSVSQVQQKEKEIIQQGQQSLSNSKKLFSQNSTKTITYQDHNDFRYSIDNLLMQGLNVMLSRQSLNQNLNNQRLSKKSLGYINKLAEIPEIQQILRSKQEINKRDSELTINSKKEESGRSIKESKELKSSKNLQTLPIFNNVHYTNNGQVLQNNSQFQINGQQLLMNSQNQNTPNQEQYQPNDIIQAFQDKHIVERFSKFIQNPLFHQQYSTGMSFQQMQSINPQHSMDYFDKVQNFKKFFPNNNFEKVVNKLKSKQLEQKRLKKQKIVQKNRRQNIMFTQNQARASIFCNSGLFKMIPQEINVDLYRPTFYSYGVGMRKGQVYPINGLTQNGD